MSLRAPLSGLILWMIASLAEPRDYCQSEYFNATCPPRNFVIMTSALYGRMKTGSCLSGAFGQMGCSEDVLDYMDRKCSGRRHCSVYIAEAALHSRNPCLRDLAVYLEAEFKCSEAITSSPRECTQQRQLTSTSHSGFLTSMEATDHSYGTTQCPWNIKVDPGQKIAFDFYNFGGNEPGTMGCHELGTITADGKVQSFTTCGSKYGRIGNIFTTDGNEATVKFLRREIIKSKPPFALFYEARGCPRDITAPAGGWVKYENNMATIKCNRSEEMWYLTCSGNRWEGERGKNCSKKFDSSWSNKQTRTEGSDGFPFGILIVVAIGVALGVFIGGLVLSLVYFYMKRKRNPYQEPPQAEQQQQQECYHGSSTLKKQPPRSPGGVLVARDTYPPIQFEDSREHVCSTTPHAHEGYYSTKAKNFGVQRVYDACASSAQRSGHVYESTQLS